MREDGQREKKGMEEEVNDDDDDDDDEKEDDGDGDDDACFSHSEAIRVADAQQSSSSLQPYV